MNEYVSVIVPIFNVEKYLLKCVDSIRNQSYKNLEILLIDDGSTDNSGIIADQLSSSDERIKVVHKANGGLSSARNKGLDICTGEFLCFVDSDDYIKSTYVEELLNACNLNNSDMAMCFYFSVKDNEELFSLDEKYNNGSIEVLTKRQACMKYLKTPYIVAWNKLYKRKVFDNIRFPDGKLHEDVGTTYKCYWNANKVAIVNRELYGYRVNDNGIMRAKYSTRRYDELCAINEAIVFFDNEYEKDINECFYRLYLGRSILHMRYALNDSTISKDYYKKVQSEAMQKLRIYGKKYRNIKEFKRFLIGILNPAAYYKLDTIKRQMKNIILINKNK